MMPSPRPRNTRQALAALQYALGTVARPNLLVLAWWWRYEFGLGIGLPVLLLVLVGVRGMLVTLVTLAVLIRWGLSLQALVTVEHFDAMARFLLLGATVLGLSYGTEWFMSWYGGEHAERDLTRYLFTGDYAPLYWTMLACNVVLPQLFWFRSCRRWIPLVFAAAILINVGMWLERILIVWNTLSHAYLPGLWKLFVPTL